MSQQDTALYRNNSTGSSPEVSADRAWMTTPQMARKFMLIAGLILGDIAAMYMVLAVAVQMRQHWLPSLFPFFPERLPQNLADYVWVMMALFILCMYYEGLYTSRLPFWRETHKTIKAITLTFILAFAGVSLMKLGGAVSRTVLLNGYLMAIIGIPLARYMVKRGMGWIGLWNEPLLVIGTGVGAVSIAEAMLRDTYLGYVITGFVAVGAEPLQAPANLAVLTQRYPVLGSLQDFTGIFKRLGIRHVVIAAPELPGQDLVALVNLIQPYVRSILVVPDLTGMPVIGGEADYFFDEQILAFRTHNNLASRLNIISKRVFDLVVGSLILLVLSPVYIVIAAAIRLSSPGPAIFSHRRIGRNGEMFQCYKFRSMVLNAAEILEDLLDGNPDLKAEWDKDFKLKDDPRVTAIGRILRKTSLDELPQIFNVLKGDMSLVGPRPVVEDEMERFGSLARDYMMVLPGITGLWQVSGRNDIDYEERVRMEAWYVKNWSLWLDISLLFRTVGIVLTRKGAY